MRRLFITAIIPAMMAFGCNGGGGSSSGGASTAPGSTNPGGTNPGGTTPITSGVVVKPGTGAVGSSTKGGSGGVGGVTSGSKGGSGGVGGVTSGTTTNPTPAVLTCTPSTAAAGAMITLAGTNLDQAVNVQVGGVALVGMKSTKTEIKGTIGTHAAGAVSITIKDTNGKIDSFPGLFSYAATTPPGGGTGTPPGGGTGTPPSGGTGTLSAKSIGNLAAARGLHSATLLDDGRVLIVGGVDATKGTFVAESEIFDPMTNTFTLTSDPTLGGNPGGYMAVATTAGKGIATARYQHTATKMSDGRVLIAGGYGVESLDAKGAPVLSDLQSTFLFDPKTNQFTLAGALQTGRSDHSAVTIQTTTGEMVMVLGGFNGTLNTNQGGSVQSVEVYDPTQGAWGGISTTGQDLNIPRQSATAVTYNGTAVIAGGLAIMPDPQTGAITPFLAPSMEMLDPTTGKFVGVQNGPNSDRFQAAMEILGTSQDLLLVGGVGGSASATTIGEVMDIERMDGTKGTWSTVGQLPTGRRHPATTVNGDQVLIAGGVSVDASGVITTAPDAILFDGTANTMATVTLGTARTSCTVTALKNGWLVAGGFSGAAKDTLGLDGQTVGTAELVSGAGSTPPPPPPPGGGTGGGTPATGKLKITGVSPATAAPGDTLTITGVNLDQAVSVTVGGTALTNLKITPTQITGTLGNHKAGAATISIKDTAGKKHTKSKAFTYTTSSTGGGGGTGGGTTAMTITNVTPNSGGAGVQVTVTGTNFANLTAVTLGGTAVVGAKFNATTITFTTPAGSVGAADLVVTSSSAGSVTKKAAYTYNTSPPPPPPPPAGLSFKTDIKPILTANCLQCHTSGPGNPPLNTYARVLTQVQVGVPAGSTLVQAITGGFSGSKDMSGYISQADAQKISDWVQQGANP